MDKPWDDLDSDPLQDIRDLGEELERMRRLKDSIRRLEGEAISD